MVYMEAHDEVNLLVCQSLKDKQIRSEKLQFNILEPKLLLQTFMPGLEYREMTIKDSCRLNQIYFMLVQLIDLLIPCTIYSSKYDQLCQTSN